MNLLTFAEQLAQELDRRIGVSFAMETVAAVRDQLRGTVTEAQVVSALLKTSACAGIYAPRARRTTAVDAALELIAIQRRGHPRWRRRSNAAFAGHLAGCEHCREGLRSMQQLFLGLLAGQNQPHPQHPVDRDALDELLLSILEASVNQAARWGLAMTDPELVRIVGAAMERTPSSRRGQLLERIFVTATELDRPPDEETLRAVVQAELDAISGTQSN